jgi:hypothetical protein
MNRTDRLYALVEELCAAAPSPRSARVLARRFQVCGRFARVWSATGARRFAA